MIQKLLISLLLFNILSLEAQETAIKKNPTSINVGVCISPPFVMETDKELSGMSIDLWEHVAKQLKIITNYKVFNSFQELVEATSKDSVDVAVTNLTITEKRAEKLDFTQPWYDAGLKIMIFENNRHSSKQLLRGLHEAGYLLSYLILAIIVIILTIVMTLVDRKYDKEFPKSWKNGLSESFYQVMLMVTSGKLSRKNLFGWVGRIVSGVWLVVGILVVAYVTSTITSVMTTLALANNITQLSDLNDKKVAVIKGSETENYIRRQGFDYISFNGMEDMVIALETGKVDAIVGDAPNLEYYEFIHQNKELEVVGNLFIPDRYSFGLSPNNNLKKEITLEILKAQESGYIRKLKSIYFGSAE